MFKYKKGYFTNIKNGKVITIKDRKDKEGQPVIVAHKYTNRNPSQIWRIIYTNKMGSETYTKKGKMSKHGTGFIVLEPFYFRSRLPMQRVVECVGANNAVLKKWAKGRKAQQWQFNPVTKTINGMYWTSYVLTMESSNLRCRSTTSKWTQLFKWTAPHLRNTRE
jgi:hypothetical protein